MHTGEDQTIGTSNGEEGKIIGDSGIHMINDNEQWHSGSSLGAPHPGRVSARRFGGLDTSPWGPKHVGVLVV